MLVPMPADGAAIFAIPTMEMFRHVQKHPRFLTPIAFPNDLRLMA
jgi:hypothetical protein